MDCSEIIILGDGLAYKISRIMINGKIYHEVHTVKSKDIEVSMSKPNNIMRSTLSGILAKPFTLILKCNSKYAPVTIRISREARSISFNDILTITPHTVMINGVEVNADPATIARVLGEDWIIRVLKL